MAQMLVLGILVNIYLIILFLILPFGYNCFYLIYCSWKYTPQISKHLEYSQMVTVQLPIYNEKYVITRLLSSIASIDWPQDKLQIQVLDDSTDSTAVLIDEIACKMKDQGFDIHVIRRPRRLGFKAGALQNALYKARGKYVVVFDADFIPSPDFLCRTIPILEEDPTLGILQTRWGHENRKYNWLTQAIALGIDGHHIIEQSGRSAQGLLLNFNGSGGVIRKEAILDSGGWFSDTLSEDMDLSYRMQLKGWKIQYQRDVIVQAEVPPSMAAFRSQQARWAKGSIQCSKKLVKRVWGSNDNSITQKIQASLHMSYYLIHPSMLVSLIITLPLLIFDGFKLMPFWVPLIVLLGLCAISSFTMYFTAIRWQGLSLRETIPFLGLLSLIGYGLSARCSLSVVGGILQKGGIFHRTPKYNIQTREDSWRSKLYKPFMDLNFLEFFFMLYSLAGMYFAFTRHNWSLMFYLSVYFMGYLTIIYNMMKH